MSYVVQIYFIAASLLVGAAVALIGPKYGVLFFGLFVSPFVIFVSGELMIFAILTFGLVLTGISTYFFSAGIQWGMYIAGLAGFFVYVVSQRNVNQSSLGISKPGVISTESLLAAVFLGCLLLSTALSRPSIYHLLVTLRDYFFLFSVFLLVGRVATNEEFLRRLWKLLWYYAVIQIPFVVYQYVFVAKGRVDEARWDSIVGTFTGSKEGGGDSGGLTVFMFSVLVLTLELVRSGAIAKHRLAVIASCVAILVGLSEVKVAFVLLSIIGLWQLLSGAKTPALTRIISAIFVLSAIAGFSWIYNEFRQDNHGSRDLDIVQRIERSLSYTVDPSSIDKRGDVGRIAAIAFWVDNSSPREDPVGFFVGHGAGSTRFSRDGIGDIAKKFYPLHVDTNAAAVLLWDSGLVGTFSVFALLVLSMRKSIHSSRMVASNQWVSAYLRAAPQIILFYALTIFYNKGLLGSSPATQIMLWVFLGLVFGVQQGLRGAAVKKWIRT